MEREWPLIQNFPSIYFLEGSVLNRANLRAVNVGKCYSCVVASAHTTGEARKSGTDYVLLDKDAILCTINIKSMPKNVKSYSDESSVNILADYINIFTEICFTLLHSNQVLELFINSFLSIIPFSACSISLISKDKSWKNNQGLESRR